MVKHKETGCFVKAPHHSVKICNPILVICQGCKNRRCDDCRYGNSLMANPAFKAASLERDVPTITKEGDMAISEDLEKAFYKIPLAKVGTAKSSRASRERASCSSVPSRASASCLA